MTRIPLAQWTLVSWILARITGRAEWDWLTLDDAGDRARVTEVSVGDRVTGQNGGEER